MPGLGLVMGVILALPFTYQMPIEPAVILLTAIYFSGTYGCFTAILYRIPGEPMDVPMLWDGCTIGAARSAGQGAGLGAPCRAHRRPGLVDGHGGAGRPDERGRAQIHLPDYFAAVFFGLTTVVGARGKSMVNSLISLCVGLLVATIGIDSIYGTDRFTFGVPILRDGVQLVERFWSACTASARCWRGSVKADPDNRKTLKSTSRGIRRCANFWRSR